MKKLTDQELDSVFKNASEGYEPPFDQAAWEAMKVKLDQPKPTMWKGWMPFAFSGLMIFSAGVWVGTYLTVNEEASWVQVPSESKDKLTQQEKMVTQKNPDQTQITTRQKQVREGNGRHEKLIQTRIALSLTKIQVISWKLLMTLNQPTEVIQSMKQNSYYKRKSMKGLKS
jgi:hypothetical protein